MVWIIILYFLLSSGVSCHQSRTLIDFSAQMGITKVTADLVESLDSHAQFTHGDIITQDDALDLLPESSDIIVMPLLPIATTQPMKVLPDIIMVAIAAQEKVDDMRNLMRDSVILFIITDAIEKAGVDFDPELFGLARDEIQPSASLASTSTQTMVENDPNTLSLERSITDALANGRVVEDSVERTAHHVVDVHVYEYMPWE